MTAQVTQTLGQFRREISQLWFTVVCGGGGFGRNFSLSLALGHPLTLTFDIFELIALFAASLIAALIALDGESNWLEGVQLLGVYLIIGIGFFFLP